MIPITMNYGKTPFANFRSSVVELQGGINENVSSLELGGGELIDCKNYMIAEGGYGGYRSVSGYERFMGGLLPSTYISLYITVRDCVRGITAGQLITGGTTGATMTALNDSVITSGSYVDSDAEILLQCRVGTGTFESLETLSTIDGVVGLLLIEEEIEGGTDEYNEGIQYARGIVEEVPGELSILGLHIFEAKTYAFRKKVGLDEIGLYVEGVMGWEEIDTSSDPMVYSVSHTFKFNNYNFYAGVDTFSMFWVDGVNQARSYDGTTYATIDNPGMSSQGLDRPINIAAHNYHLWLAYDGGSLQFSQLGEPMGWDAVLGASEIGLGDEITNLIPGVGSSLVITLGGGIRVLQGNSVDDFSLEVFSADSGAYRGTARRLLGTVFMANEKGLTTLDAINNFGDYAANTISQKFKQTLLSTVHSITTTTTSKDFNQYRIFFDDRTAIFVSFEGAEQRGATLIEYNRVVSISAQGEDIDSRDYTVFATDDELGFVYRMDSGTSFDGEPILTRMSTAFYHYGSPRQYKAFKRATLEIAGETSQIFNLKVDFDYNETGGARTQWYAPEIYTIEGTAIYGEGKWGTMKYGVGVAATNRVPIYLQGIGTNMSYKLISNEMYKTPHVVQNIITDYESMGRRI